MIPEWKKEFKISDSQYGNGAPSPLLQLLAEEIVPLRSNLFMNAQTPNHCTS